MAALYILEIASWQEIQKIESPSPGYEEDSSTVTDWPVKPPWLRKVTQGEMFKDYGFSGMGHSQNPIVETRIKVGVIETGFFRINHEAFLDDIGGESRIEEFFNCNCFDVIDGEYCDEYSGEPFQGCDAGDTGNGDCSDHHLDYCYRPPEGSDPEIALGGRHATSVTGIVGADCLEDQCHYFVNQPEECDNRTGMAKETSIVTINRGTRSNLGLAVEVGALTEVDIINYSMGHKDLLNDGTIAPPGIEGVCPNEAQATGYDDRSIDANDAYQAGILFVKSAGNQAEDCTYNHEEPDFTCTLTSPGAAAGVLTVGAYSSYGWDYIENIQFHDDPYNDFEGSMKLMPYSSSGRTLDFRVKPDILAPSLIACLPKYYYTDEFFDCSIPYDDTALGGTSAAAPTVAGAAALLKDWMLYEEGSASPGKLIANIINFGDRIGTASKGFFHDDYGAGRLRLRLPTTRGMDTPFKHETIAELFFPGETNSYDLGSVIYNGNVPAAAKILKIAVWWYEPEVEKEDGYPTASFVMSLSSPSMVSPHTVYSFGYKQRNQKMQMIFDNSNNAFLAFNTGTPYTLTITNLYMQTSSPAPGVYPVNARTLYITYFWEDTDRDDVDCAPCSDQVGPARCLCDDTDNDYLFYR